MPERPLTPPIFIAEGHDVMVFRDATAAEKTIEAIDVDNGVFQGWDATGRVLQLRTAPKGGLFGFLGTRVVCIASDDSDATQPERLWELLAAVLERHASQQTTGKQLPKLIRIFVEWARYTS